MLLACYMLLARKAEQQASQFKIALLISMNRNRKQTMTTMKKKRKKKRNHRQQNNTTFDNNSR